MNRKDGTGLLESKVPLLVDGKGITLESDTPKITYISNSSVSCACFCHLIDPWSRHWIQNWRAQVSISVLELKPRTCCIKLMELRLTGLSWFLYFGPLLSGFRWNTSEARFIGIYTSSKFSDLTGSLRSLSSKLLMQLGTYPRQYLYIFSYRKIKVVDELKKKPIKLNKNIPEMQHKN